jgi:hypothetical protein
VSHEALHVGGAPSLVDQARMLAGTETFRSELVAGGTYTTSSKVSLTLEYEYNGAGLDRAAWDALRRGPPLLYARYRALTTALQEMPTRRRVFADAHWQDAVVDHLDLTAFAYYDCVDDSRQAWLEARYHWTAVDLALQWQVNGGSPGSEYRALPARQAWQLLIKYFF